MKDQIIKAVHAVNKMLRDKEGSQPTTPSEGLLARKGAKKDTTEMSVNDNVASYVKQIREARNTHA